jgi:glutamyl-Q tRNA(Asp) synthetase
VSAAKSNTATATTATVERGATPVGRDYIGRFAPSPSGDLHLGSLFTAVASFLEARSHGGQWLLRIEDLDTPREIKGAASRIMDTLAAFGFEWPEPVLRQSARIAVYQSVINELEQRGLIYRCRCSRRDLREEERYPGTCRELHWPADTAAALRLRVDAGVIHFEDALQGSFRQDVARSVGDYILQRRDGIIAYALAVVVDDAAQGITHIVRGADLLDSTARQIYLQRELNLPTPVYTHVPVLMEAGGSKLAKSRRSIALDPQAAGRQLCAVLALFALPVPPDLHGAGLRSIWKWAQEHWASGRLSRHLSLNVPAGVHLP